ncbi:MAG: hypothetical protein IPH52_16065 [Leptospiraceae bacterium]|nr:hypothetical protein [Leptospiraceae bacterium]
MDVNAIPWHDGSHHFTLAANLFNDLRGGDYGKWTESIRNFPELALAYTILTLPLLF